MIAVNVEHHMSDTNVEMRMTRVRVRRGGEWRDAPSRPFLRARLDACIPCSCVLVIRILKETRCMVCVRHVQWRYEPGWFCSMAVLRRHSVGWISRCKRSTAHHGELRC